MKKAFLLCAALALVCGSSYGITYTWLNHSTAAGASWDTAANWSSGSPGTIPGRGDAVVINTGGRAERTVTAGAVTTMGSLLVDNGSWTAFNDSTGNPYVIKTLDNVTTGAAGDFTWRSTHQIRYPIKFTVDVAGNFLIPGSSGIWSNSGNGGTLNSNYIILRGPQDGTSRAFRYGRTELRAQMDCINILGTYWDNGTVGNTPGSLLSGGNVMLTVDVGPSGRIVRNPNGTTASAWIARRFIFEGGQSNLPNVGDCVDFAYSCSVLDNNPSQPLVIAGGVTYPRNVTVGSSYIGSLQNKTSVYTWKMKGGALIVPGDFKFQNIADQFAKGTYWFSTLENGTTTSDCVTVNGNVTVGTFWNQPAAGGFQDYGVRLNNSTVRIGGSLFVGTTYDNGGAIPPTGAIDFGGSTVRLGKDLTIRKPSTWMLSNWNPGTSTLICDGNGTTPVIGRFDQILTTRGDCGITLNNLVINNECGTVSLANSTAGILRLSGDLRLEKGKFNDNDRAIFFNGPNHTLFWDNNTCKVTGTTPNALDNIILLPNAVVTLDAGSFTTIKMDNIEMQSGSKLYLNGFTLIADGKSPWVSSEVSNQGVGYEQGTIYGTLVIPEPATLLLLGTGLLGALGWARRRRMK